MSENSDDGDSYATSEEEERGNTNDGDDNYRSDEESERSSSSRRQTKKVKRRDRSHDGKSSSSGPRSHDGKSSSSGRSGGSGRKRSKVISGSRLVSASKSKKHMRGGVIDPRGRSGGLSLSDMSMDGGGMATREELAARLKVVEDMNRKQRDVIDKHREEVSELRDQVKYNRNGKGKGKNRTRKKETLSPLDEMNRAQINNYIRKYLFPRYKILPRSWPTYSTDPKSFCQHIMSKVKVPGGSDEEIYWEGTIRDLVNEKYGALKANFKASMWKQFVGELLL